MKKVWNKETINEFGVYYRNGDWGVEVPDDFKKPNFVEVSPPEEAFEGVPYSWDVKVEKWLPHAEATKKVYDKLRRKDYPEIGDQLDALWKQMNQDRLGGKALIQDADDMLGAVLAIKAKYPKK